MILRTYCGLDRIEIRDPRGRDMIKITKEDLRRVGNLLQCTIDQWQVNRL